MAWSDIIGQEKIKRLLINAVLENKVAHSYCFWGIEGIGKEAMALEFAKTLNCLSPLISENKIESCGYCQGCRQMATLRHPNIQLVFSLPPGKTADSKNESVYSKLSDEQLLEIGNQILRKSRDYYYKIELQNASRIKIASIREIRKNLSKSQLQPGRRIIIVFRADEMNQEAENSFLKTLEEPSDNTTIILTTSRPELLLPTILSRCQQVHFPPLATVEISDTLIIRHAVNHEKAKISAALAQGSYSRSLDYLNDDVQALKKQVVEALRASLRKRNYRKSLVSQIDGILKAKDNLLLEKFLNILLIWIRDAGYIALTGNPSNVYNIDDTEVLSRFAEGFKGKDFEPIILHVEKAISQIRRNVRHQLILLNMFINIRNYLLN